MVLEWKNVSGTNKDFNLKNISFVAEPGYLIGIAGKNGAGKTTMFRYMMEKKKQYTGEILLDGEPLHRAESKVTAGNGETGSRNGSEDVHIKQLNHIAYISDDRQFIGGYTAMDNAELLSVLYDNWDMECFKAAMKRMELSLSKNYGDMSRGEKLKFQMAFAMGYQPKLYLLDEVTGGMDPVFRKEFFRILREILAAEEAIVIMTTHIQEELEEKMDYIGIMEAGQLVSFAENEAV